MDLFKSIKTFKDLKKLKACQGTHWPDTKILEDAGIKVVKNTRYEAMFLQVQYDRCDYFPRGVHEAYSEIQVRKDKYKDLMLYDKLIIYYPFPMYFFVAKENKLLAQRVKQGLLHMINNGSFDEFMKENKITNHLFPLEKWINSKMFELNNLYLSKDTNFKDKMLWIVKE